MGLEMFTHINNIDYKLFVVEHEFHLFYYGYSLALSITVPSLASCVFFLLFLLFFFDIRNKSLLILYNKGCQMGDWSTIVFKLVGKGENAKRKGVFFFLSLLSIDFECFRSWISFNFLLQ